MKMSILLAMILLSACANQPQRILRKDVSEDEVQRDTAACQLEAQKIQMADYAYRGTFLEGYNIKTQQNKAMELCLISKGYK